MVADHHHFIANDQRIQAKIEQHFSSKTRCTLILWQTALRSTSSSITHRW